MPDADLHTGGTLSLLPKDQTGVVPSGGQKSPRTLSIVQIILFLSALSDQ